MTVVSIRGTHGSGKSTIVKKILEKYPHTPNLSARGKPLSYTVKLSRVKTLCVVGPYVTACGG